MLKNIIDSIAEPCSELWKKQRRAGWGGSSEAEDGGLSKGDLKVVRSGECPFLDREGSEISEAVEQSGAARGQGGRLCV